MPRSTVATFDEPTVRHAAVDVDESNEARLSEVAVTAFNNIADLWGLTVDQRLTLLGAIPKSTYFKFSKTPSCARFSRDTLHRVSHLIGIFKAVNILLPVREAADSWVKRPNAAPLFKGACALDYMLQGDLEDIAAVRHYLDAQRGT